MCFDRPIVSALSLVLVLAVACACLADVRLPAIIGDNMVLQRQSQFRIWGWAEPGEKVTVSVSWLSMQWDLVADKQGNWDFEMKSPKGPGPYEMTIGAGNTIKIKNIAVGEVWLCSGQSNMEFRLRSSVNGEDEVSAASYPDIRLFHVQRDASGRPRRDCTGSWAQCSAETVANFSAVGYFFGRELHKQLGVPVGLINNSWGGTRIEPWTPPVGFATVPKLREIVEQIKQADSEFNTAVAQELEPLEKWIKACRKALAANKPVPAMPALPKHELSSRGKPTGLYNAMVHPIVPFAIRGAIWYQGESNHTEGMMYYEKMKALINGWRNVWGQGRMPFYFVQLAPYQYGDEDPRILPVIWQAQTAALAIPNTGMAVTVDVGNIKDIHPKNKQDVGRRLALWALAKTYNRKNLVYSGPLYKSMSVEGSSVRISFEHSGSGLASSDGKALTWFTIAGQDKKFVEAEAQIDGDTIVVSSGQVSKPAAVRFAWHKEAEPNLVNKEGLPASPFRTDDWPVDVENEK